MRWGIASLLFCKNQDGNLCRESAREVVQLIYTYMFDGGCSINYIEGKESHFKDVGQHSGVASMIDDNTTAMNPTS
jgi:hypothetical protein